MSARLFAALELPADVRAGLADFGREAAAHDRALRPTRGDALHLTLAFLGHRALDEVDPAREAVRGVAGSPAPVLTLADPLWLAPRRPHVQIAKQTSHDSNCVLNRPHDHWIDDRIRW